jgi:ABC-type Fe3+ transport system permease subunit
VNAIRCGLVLILLLAFAIPLLGPILDLPRSPQGFAAWRESDRIFSLLGNSFSLFALTSLIAVPWGTLFAILLERTYLRGKGALRAAVLFGVVLPIPVAAVAWQAAFGNILPRLSLDPGTIAWQPWNKGLLPAAWIHAMVGLPWVIAIVSIALRQTDPAVEEEALALGGRHLVFRAVIGPRLILAMLAALAWLAIQTTTEIAITDMMMVRTYAEEVYTQQVIGGAGIGSSMALTLPMGAVFAVVVLGFGKRWYKRYSRTSGEMTRPRQYTITPGLRFPIVLFAWLTPLIFLGVPFAALVVKASTGSNSLFQQLATVVRTDGVCLLTSTATALGVGLLTAALARWCCWAARESARFRMFLFGLSAALVFTPGPIIGFGLKEMIRRLVDLEEIFFAGFDFPPLRSLLYDQPSPLPAGWAAVLRLFPLACLIQWPIIAAIPKEFLELSALDGRSPFSRWRLAVAPPSRDAFLFASFLVAALAMGEVSAAKIANPPFFDVYILRLFDQMHYGSESSVAALCLVQLILTGSMGVLWWATRTTSSVGTVPES